jgi:hypothetical protein
MGITAAPCEARVTQINIVQVDSPTFGDASFGAVGQYERIEGTITGRSTPKTRSNAVIVDIGLAPRNGDGSVAYSAGIVNLSGRGMLIVSVARQLGWGNFLAHLLCCPLKPSGAGRRRSLVPLS